MSDIDEAVREFLVESIENMDQLDRDLVALEKTPTSREILARIFRTIHTIKGTCGFLGFSRLESVTHVGESLLSRLRDGDMLMNPEITSALLLLVDAVRQMLAFIEAQGNDGDGDYSALIDTLTRLLKSERKRSAPPAPAPPPVVAAPPPPAPVVVAPPPPPPPPVVVAPPPPPPMVVAPPPRATEPPIHHSLPPHKPQGSPMHRENAESKAPASPPEGSENRASGISDSTIRVDVGLLDKLMNLVGELVLARNQILQYTATQKDAAFVATSQRLNLITTELQEGVMKTRMQPIGNIWGKFPRVVRDLALTCSKQVHIEMEGKDTELDKTIIEAIKDPLTHLIRNGVDHGIEPSAARALRGKNPEGRLLLRAFHEGGQVNIEITDDGGGIDLEKIRTKVVNRGMMTQDHAVRLSDRDLVNMIFLPGFSTAEKITNVSGRGVGMDVVKTNIEKIGGTIDVMSKHHYGTTFKIKIPLTLAIIPALVVTSGVDRYAIPQVNLLELVRLEGERIKKGIEMIHGAPVYRLRGNLLPLAYLSKELGTAAPDDPGVRGRESVNIVVLQAGDRQFGLVVDGINDTEEIVVKPLGKQLKGIPCFAGATIMGDGRVALILDVLSVAQKANVVSEVRDRAIRDKFEQVMDRNESRQALLLFRTKDDGRMAIPLSMVARLEEFPKSSTERVGGQSVVQYRGQILPLVKLSQVLPERRRKPRPQAPAPAVVVAPSAGQPPPTTTSPEAETLQVVVFASPGRSVGLVVDRILDIVEEVITVQRPASRPGVLGSAVIQSRVTELLDVEGVIRSVEPGYRPQVSPRE